MIPTLFSPILGRTPQSSYKFFSKKSPEEEIMAFVNEYIPAEDVERYDIENINKMYVCGGVSGQWTIDRDRNIYLREVAAGVGHSGNSRIWNLFWHGELIEIKIEILASGGERNAPCWSHKKIRNIQLPAQLEVRRVEILAGLKEALTTYRDGGVFATATTYTLTLEV